jgi:hypothetical protein
MKCRGLLRLLVLLSLPKLEESNYEELNSGKKFLSLLSSISLKEELRSSGAQGVLPRGPVVPPKLEESNYEELNSDKNFLSLLSPMRISKRLKSFRCSIASGAQGVLPRGPVVPQS